MGNANKWKIEEHEVLDSTNARAIELVRDAFSRPEPNIDHIAIVAKRQTTGRGQHGRIWESPPGGLYLSAILQNIPLEWRPMLPLIVGVAIADTLEMLGHRNADIRWPNDILLEGKKIAGVLCEGVAQGSQWAAIIGVGINVNTPLNSLPSELQNTATSLHLHQASQNIPAVPRHEEVERLRDVLLFALDRRLPIAREKEISKVLIQARKLDYLLHKQIEFQLDDHTLTGIASGIGDHGELLVQVDDQIIPLTHATLLSIDGQPLRP